MNREQLTEDLPVGGQAVIEGVMMRVPGKIVTAVRAADQEIVVREEAYEAWSRRYRLLGVPIVRGAVSFFEMMFIGLKALNFSADVAMRDSTDAPEEREDGWKDQLSLVATLAFSLALGVGLFFFVPLAIAEAVKLERGVLQFNALAGAVRAILLVLYLWGISHWSEIQRVFQYHGAEHKSIFTLEAGAELSVEQARLYGRLHPRCGTSFMLIVALFSIAIFAVADALFVVAFGHAQNLLERFATHLAVLPLVSGSSFELLKFSGRKRNNPLVRILMKPGLWLQRITTREPDDSQLEVALVALRRAIAESEKATGI
ncbi:MAG: hypothetical protein ACI906_001219 [Candidatus Latescibacterota bacterium]|jgi:uncharacterized protein YqhQ